MRILIILKRERLLATDNLIYYASFLSKQLSILPNEQRVVEVNGLYLPDTDLQLHL